MFNHDLFFFFAFFLPVTYVNIHIHKRKTELFQILKENIFQLQKTLRLKIKTRKCFKKRQNVKYFQLNRNLNKNILIQ